MPITDTLLVIVILGFLFLMIYSKMKDQDLRDSIDELKDIIQPISITEVAPYSGY